MAKKYSEAKRTRVLTYLADGNSLADAEAHFKISAATIRKWRDAPAVGKRDVDPNRDVLVYLKHALEEMSKRQVPPCRYRALVELAYCTLKGE